MAKWTITRACGHDETVQLYGSRRQRESRAEWLAESDCYPCREAERDRERAELSEKNAAKNRAQGLPELEGSPKQVAWAETIRADMIGTLTHDLDRFTRVLESDLAVTNLDREVKEERRKHASVALAALKEIASAKWFIENRGYHTYELVARAAQGRLRPRTEAQQRDGFDPFGLNTLAFPAGEVVGETEDGRYVRLRLVRSRWEGCTVSHPLSMAETAPDGTVTIRFGGEWDINVSDGARTRSVLAEQFFQDRTHRPDEPGERHYWPIPPYSPIRWNEFDVPAADVSEREAKGGRRAVVQMVCSRWEGLYFEHPLTMVRRHRPGFVTIRFGPQWEFKLLGGKQMLRVGGKQMYQDRAAPLPEPGESLAVEQRTWHAVTFHPSRVRFSKRDVRWVRLGPQAPWPEAVIFHPARMCRTGEDGYIVWRFPEDWTFRGRTPDNEAVEMTAEEFVKATSSWAATAPQPGTYTREPEDLVPPDEIEIPADLLEDDPFITQDAA